MRSSEGSFPCDCDDARFKLMFDRSADAVLLLDTGTNDFVEYNQATLDMLRCTRAELSSLHPSALSPPRQPDGRDSFEKANEMIALAIARGSHRFEWVHRGPRRDDFPVEVVLTTLSVGPAPMLMVVWRDITERKRAEEAMRQAQRLESLGVLAGGIAHDFNNILAAVCGHVELARRTLAQPEEAREHLETIELAVARAAHLTRQILAYSGRGRFFVEPLDLGGLTREMIELLRISASKRVQIVCEHPAEPLVVEADRAQTQQVLMNLFTNAAEAIGDAEGKISVRTYGVALDDEAVQRDFPGQTLAAGAKVVLEVEDTGQGMPREVQARIFDPFFSTKGTGRGLGLSALLGILKGHQAGVAIDSRVGVGTRFRVFFPASVAAVAPKDAARRAAGRGKGTVLVVDDEPGILRTLEVILADLGFTVVTARDGYEAIEVFRANRARVDCVLLDLTMPGMSGDSVFLAMQAIDPEVKVVVTSGWAAEEVLARFAERAPAAVLAKPFTTYELSLTLARLGLLHEPAKSARAPAAIAVGR